MNGADVRKENCVLHATSNFVISRRCQDENGKDVYQNVKCTYGASRAIVLRLSRRCGGYLYLSFPSSVVGKHHKDGEHNVKGKEMSVSSLSALEH